MRHMHSRILDRDAISAAPVRAGGSCKIKRRAAVLFEFLRSLYWKIVPFCETSRSGFNFVNGFFQNCRNCNNN